MPSINAAPNSMVTFAHDLCNIPRDGSGRICRIFDLPLLALLVTVPTGSSLLLILLWVVFPISVVKSWSPCAERMFSTLPGTIPPKFAPPIWPPP